MQHMNNQTATPKHLYPMNQGSIGLRERIAQLSANPNAKAVAVGVAAVALTPVVLPLMKPVLKATIKSGVSLYEKTKGAIAETGESLADVVAEARAEAQTEAQQKAALTASNNQPQAPNAEG